MSRIYGQRIRLREYQSSDFEDIRGWVINPEITGYLSDIFLYPNSEKDTRDFLNKAMSNEWTGFVIADIEDGDYIGQIDFVNLDLKNGYGVLGLVIGDNENLGKGLGSEALDLILDFAFNQLRLNRVELVCWEYNHRAQRSYEKVGFVKEGIRRQKRYRNGKYHDEICYGILKDEWQSRQDN
ncbi:RimJ/RimL family protein N-acetyltransferase [Orenia metallireducens]|uniref:Protein N-acetyltransferase, RimJ/RimL family n=1 Tax=Orenia metallireducens TaxID=1413210 RepID=A0A285GMV8_9FIRM|nr:GNAT family protein [Orenia metallireducens]PRX29793.1 RimJ/RimL family protein N-acetyltransferase [Orenia metallireducens]SNY24902.1 Protein N-acetyltransferase, RimJ/RimL family [Orenia metallireducens]